MDFKIIDGKYFINQKEVSSETYINLITDEVVRKTNKIRELNKYSEQLESDNCDESCKCDEYKQVVEDILNAPSIDESVEILREYIQKIDEEVLCELIKLITTDTMRNVAKIIMNLANEVELGEIDLE
jgi:hypothetical protein